MKLAAKDSRASLLPPNPLLPMKRRTDFAFRTGKGREGGEEGIDIELGGEGVIHQTAAVNLIRTSPIFRAGAGAAAAGCWSGTSKESHDGICIDYRPIDHNLFNDKLEVSSSRSLSTERERE
jgi:hypothetical protein